MIDPESLGGYDALRFEEWCDAERLERLDWCIDCGETVDTVDLSGHDKDCRIIHNPAQLAFILEEPT